jgi:hypothetical protein
VSVLLIDDQETVVRALEVARAILGECIAGQRDAAKTVERLVSALNKSEVIQALDRMTGVESCDGLILEMGHRCRAGRGREHLPGFSFLIGRHCRRTVVRIWHSRPRCHRKL